MMEQLRSGDLLLELAPEITEVVSQLRFRKPIRPSLTYSLIVLLPLVLRYVAVAQQAAHDFCRFSVDFMGLGEPERIVELAGGWVLGLSGFPCLCLCEALPICSRVVDQILCRCVASDDRESWQA